MQVELFVMGLGLTRRILEREQIGPSKNSNRHRFKFACLKSCTVDGSRSAEESIPDVSTKLIERIELFAGSLRI